ncbi:hypothetical protein WJX74_000938 [Apatococcus lobatus]|uniref:Uncharacterized protein n=1 Tax=Apatococcus lobatus TaxID=904363 RepID=A0AAW1RBU6_9CHLO
MHTSQYVSGNALDAVARLAMRHHHVDAQAGSWHLIHSTPVSSCSPEDFLAACDHPAVANVLEWLADSATIPLTASTDGQGSIKLVLAAMYTICKRASISKQELYTPTMYALIWILRSIDSQWFSWAHHTVKDFLKAAELHERYPAPPQRYEDCLSGLIKMQAQLLCRCKWRLAMDWVNDIIPAIEELASCPAQNIFQWLCSLSSDNLAPITPATSEAPAYLLGESACGKAAGAGHHQQDQQCASPASNVTPMQRLQSAKMAPAAASEVVQTSQPGNPSTNPATSFSNSRNRQALAEITSQTCNSGGLNGSYWHAGMRRSHRRNKPRH